MIFENASDAIAIDGHLDRLLGAGPAAVAASDEAIDPALLRTVEVVQRILVRFHPSFRFEERLAARLRTQHGVQPGEAGGRVVPFPAPLGTSAPTMLERTERRSRGLIVGGAIASGVSIASIGAVLAWRRHSAERPA